MKKSLSFLLTMALAIFEWNSVVAQNRLDIYYDNGDSISIKGIDSVTYSKIDTNGIYGQYWQTQEIWTWDSLYRIPLSPIQSMKYEGFSTHVTGTVDMPGGLQDDLMIMSIYDVCDLESDDFEINVFNSHQAQTLVVMNQDSLPLMLYRNTVKENRGVVIDASSTALALLTLHPFFGGVSGPEFDTVADLINAAPHFEEFKRMVTNRIEQSIPLVDSTDFELLDMLDTVFLEVIGDPSGWGIWNSRSDVEPYINHEPIVVTCAGNVLYMKLPWLYPSYYGEMTDGDGNWIRDVAVKTREDFGVLDLIYNRTFYGDVTECPILGEGQRQLNLSCRNAAANVDLAYKVLGSVLDAIGIAISDEAMGLALDAVEAGIGMMDPSDFEDINSNAVRALADIAWHAVVTVVSEEMPLNMGRVNIRNFGLILKRATMYYDLGKMLVNLAMRTYYRLNSPGEISFCVEYYQGESIEPCVTTELSIVSGNEQTGNPGSTLEEPLTFMVTTYSDNHSEVSRNCPVKLWVEEGEGELSDTIVSVMSNYFVGITEWTLGDSTAYEQHLPQIVKAVACDVHDMRPVSDTIEFKAYFGEPKNIFSVSDSRKVQIAPGNLQFQASTETWRFAPVETESIGQGNANIGPGYSGWIDLFGWATSGFMGYEPWLHSTNPEDYLQGLSDIDNTQFDWGEANYIGIDPPGTWRTMTAEEWDYLINSRENAASLRGLACVNQVKGLIILPDEWENPLPEISFHNDVSNWNVNVYNGEDWNAMKTSGAAFLPVTYGRGGTTVGSSEFGGYWSSSSAPPTPGYCESYSFMFRENTINTATSVPRFGGRAVRLVKDFAEE